MATPLPKILMPCDHRMLGDHPFHIVGDKYVVAARDIANCLPLLVPGGAPSLLDQWLDSAHGLLVTGAVSNLNPQHYGEALLDASRPQDPVRDVLALALLMGALTRGMPILAICRGFQELNVAHGGTLHQSLENSGGFHDHKVADTEPTHAIYAPLHDVVLSDAGVLAQITHKNQLRVNSVHEQGIKTLGSGLQVEATAPDGLIEAFSKPNYVMRSSANINAKAGFCLAVQWHPEWQAAQNADSIALFTAFGQACLDYAQESSDHIERLHEHRMDSST